MIATVLPALLFAATATCPPPASADWAGLWESKDRSKGGIGHTIELRPDGSYVESTSVLVDGFYRIADGKLMISEKPIVDAAATGDSTPFQIDGDTLVQRAPGAPEIRKQRLGKAEPGKDPIVGAWRYRHPTGATAYERYTPDGQMSLRLPMTSSTGCYKMEAGKVTLSRSQGGDLNGTFEMKGEDLVLTFADQSAAYRKEPAGAWYEREKVDIKPPR
jgi:hypothetical protein